MNKNTNIHKVQPQEKKRSLADKYYNDFKEMPIWHRMFGSGIGGVWSIAHQLFFYSVCDEEHKKPKSPFYKIVETVVIIAIIGYVLGLMFYIF
jgi:hypothetical protein